MAKRLMGYLVMPAFAIMLIVGLCQSQGCQASQKAETAAKDDTFKAVTPTLELVATAHPDKAAEVRDLVDRWTTRSEKDDAARAIPLLQLYAAEHPDEGVGIKLLIRSWQRRLAAFDTAATSPSPPK